MPDEALITETAIWPIVYLITIMTVLEEIQFHLQSMQPVLYRLATVQCLLVNHLQCRLYHFFCPLRSVRVF